MMLLSRMKGNVSRSERKRSACIKVLYFTIWNVFFVNVLSESIISQLSVFSSVRDIPTQLAKVVPTQILRVYVSKYESGGQFWPIVHSTTIFSLVLTQIIALVVFGLKQSPIASGFTIPLILFTLLFNEYCRQRFPPVFKRSPAQVLIEMDRQDKQWGRVEEIYNLRSVYCQLPLISRDLSISQDLSTAGTTGQHEDQESSQDPESPKPGIQLVKLNE